MEHDTSYTVTVRGRGFLLTKSQIEFDGPNYFTTCFLGDFKKTQTRQIKLPRDPDLFLIVFHYLCGYKVLPLSDRVIPTGMSPELALENLKIDAAFYQLDGLVEQCDALMPRPLERVKGGIRKPYLVLGCEYSHDETGPFEKHVATAIKSSVWSIHITKERLTEEPFTSMKRPENHKGFQGLRTIAAVESFARTVRQVELELVGWHIEKLPYEGSMFSDEPLDFRLMVVLAI
ncbi:unnamed protein product [Rhizoctonia solani]|uniref:BTB domain-containing protein n=1 Tax=Rhizoctonia solani TaxID=456999 RepID=A0A8H3CAA4_9AGAM|nr:unnamed protein product [Rhizoctonia solani]